MSGLSKQAKWDLRVATRLDTRSIAHSATLLACIIYIFFFSLFTLLFLFFPFLIVFPGSENSSTSSNQHELRDVASVAALQDQAQLTLSKYIGSLYPTQQAFRFGRLLLTLPSLRAVSTNSIEELFFRKTIGNIAIVRLLSDMYK